MKQQLIAWLLCAAALLAAPVATAQTTSGDSQAAAASEQPLQNSAQAQSVRRLQAIQQALEEKRARVRDLLELLATANEIEQARIREQISDAQETIAQLTRSFETIAANGASLRSLEPQPEEKLSWHDELMQVAQPLLNSLKEATEKPRRIEELRRGIDLYEKQYALAQKAIDAIAQYDRQRIPPEVASGLDQLASNWQERSRDIERSLEHAQQDLESLESEDIDLVGTVLGVGREFFLGRGLTLLIALITGVALWFLMRSLRLLVSARRQPREDSERAARIRLLLYAYHLFTIVLVSLGVLSVFYVRGDLLLLSLSIIALIMLALGTWRYLPRYLEEGRLLLNVGNAREGERVMYNGLPFRITSLNLYSELRNPELEGVIRLPLSSLGQLISRPRGNDSWFPCRAGDYLLLDDGSFAQVQQQTIERIRLRVTGSILEIASADFLGRDIRNISTEGFGVAVTFGIDYAHQPIALDEVPQKLQAGISAAFSEAGFGDDLRDLQVDFKAAAASSLDYLVYASMDGNSAGSYFAIGRVIQQACVATCNHEGWGIPFTQVTVHQAGSPPA